MIIGFTGRMGTGKSTAIEVIKGLHKSTALIKFAGPLYRIQEAVYAEISPVYKRPEGFVKDRKLLQWIGTDWARETISKTIWVDLFKAEVKRLQTCPYPPIVLCDDVRFDNEAEAIHEFGGKVVQLVGPTRGAEVGIKAHSSEVGINPSLVDFTITNEGDKDEFRQKIVKLCMSLE